MEQVIEAVQSQTRFLEANTIEVSREEIAGEHIIPVFTKSNEPLISQVELLNVVEEAICIVAPAKTVSGPFVRVSHPIKGRIPEARHKKAEELLEHEKTLYYERMAFFYELPEIQAEIGGNTVSLSIGGIKAYSSDNLSSRNQNNQSFKLFIGFKNFVCTNLCISSDGYISDFRTGSSNELSGAVVSMIEKFNLHEQVSKYEYLSKVSLTEREFINVIGRLKLFLNLPADERQDLLEHNYIITESQLSSMVRSYVEDSHFGRKSEGPFSLWKLYNLFTGSVKSSYIDHFIDRSVFAYDLSHGLGESINSDHDNWFLE